MVNKTDLAKEIINEEDILPQKKQSKNRLEILEMVAKKIALRKLLNKS